MSDGEPRLSDLVLINGGPTAWYGILLGDLSTLEGIQAAEFTTDADRVVAIAIELHLGTTIPVGLCWDSDHSNALINPERYYNHEVTNTLFVGVYPRDEQPDEAELRAIEGHLRHKACCALQRRLRAVNDL